LPFDANVDFTDADGRFFFADDDNWNGIERETTLLQVLAFGHPALIWPVGFNQNFFG
jgi:hypothetical protein